MIEPKMPTQSVEAGLDNQKEDHFFKTICKKPGLSPRLFAFLGIQI